MSVTFTSLSSSFAQILLDLQESRDKRIRTDYHWAKIEDGVLNAVGDVFNLNSKRTGDGRNHKPGIGSHVAQVPTIESTIPVVDDSQHYINDDVDSSNNLKDSFQRGETIKITKVQPQVQRPVIPLAARQFRLLKDPFSSLSDVNFRNGVKKSSSKSKTRAPLFTERHAVHALQLIHQEASIESGATDYHGSDSPATHINRQASAATRTYKKPNAAAEEVKWRSKTWNKQAENDKNTNLKAGKSERGNHNHSSHEEYSLKLAMQLQEFAVEETQIRERSPPASQLSAHLKFQPKPPRPRPKMRPANIDEIENSGTVPSTAVVENDEDFVFETFIRTQGPMNIPDKTLESSQSLQNSSKEVALLVIDEEDEEAWQQYVEDIESEREWETDDEDENG